MYIIRSDAGQPLRDELAKSHQKILTSAFPEFIPKSEAAITPGSTSAPAAAAVDDDISIPPSDSSSLPTSTSSAPSDGYFQGLALIKTLVKLIPGWLHSNHTVFDTLVLIWKSPARISRLRNEQELDLVQVSFFISIFLFMRLYAMPIFWWRIQRYPFCCIL